MSTLKVDLPLIQKYNVPGPRYTSYPTADRFHEAFGPADYVNALLERRENRPRDPLSLYVHVPFCNTLCFYCACNKVITKDHGRSAKYIRYVAREVDIVASILEPDARERAPVAQVHLGGGTPTFLARDEMSALMGHLRRAFPFAPDAEVSIEVDPRKVDADTIAFLGSIGFYHLEAGHWGEAIRWSVRALRQAPTSPRRWAFLAAAFAGPRALHAYRRLAPQESEVPFVALQRSRARKYGRLLARYPRAAVGVPAARATRALASRVGLRRGADDRSVLLLCIYRARNADTVARMVAEADLRSWDLRLWALDEAAPIPEAALTAWTNLVVEGGLAAGETVLVTGATSGIGTFAVQMIRELGGTVVAAARSAERLERLREFGVDRLVTLDADYPRRVRELTGGEGVDLVLDLVAGEWLAPTLECLRARGRLILVGLTAGRKVQLDLGLVLRQRLRIVGSTLRARPVAEKAELVRTFSAWGLPRLADGRLRPVVDRIFPLAAAAEAYAVLEHERPLGKLLLQCSSPSGSAR